MSGKDFLGRGLKFPLQIDPSTGRLAMSVHEEDIKEAVGIIIRTYHGERVMRPDFGTSIYDYSFIPTAHYSTEAIEYEIKNQLDRQELRITDVSVSAQPAEGVDTTLVVSVEYTVRSTNNRYNVVYPFYKMEGIQP